jgi:superfamily I DNA/RNA helicase
MQLLKANKRARIKGRDIGKGLTKLVNQLRARTIPELLQKLEVWKERQVNRLQAKFKSRPAALQSRIEGIIDQSDMITSFAMDAPNVSTVVSLLETLFVDDGRGSEGTINCSSVHRAKGLEANTVYVLAHTLRRDSQEEENIAYVAITRAKNRLVYVSEGGPEGIRCPRCGVPAPEGTTCGCEDGSVGDTVGSGTRKPRKTRRK